MHDRIYFLVLGEYSNCPKSFLWITVGNGDTTFYFDTLEHR